MHEEWNDGIRKLGADKFSSHDPEGMKAFIRLCHDFGIKVIPYVSTGFFDVRALISRRALRGIRWH